MAEVRNRRLVVMVSASEAEAVERYRWENKIGSIGKAVRDLIEKGLAAPADAQKAERPVAPTTSRS